MILALLMAWLGGWSERNHPTLAAFVIDQCPNYATIAEGEWWADDRSRLESLKIAASQLGWFRPARERPCWEHNTDLPLSWCAMGFLNVVRMRRQGVIAPDADR
jgi:hypothetical protein